MSRFYSHVNTAKTIIELYQGEMPLSAFLKTFFAKEKKYGSRDRKTISSLCYNYFRLGFALREKSVDERILTATFLVDKDENGWLESKKREWNEKITLPLDEKLGVARMDVQSIFPFNQELSEGIDVKGFNTSFLVQPDVFVRVRPNRKPIIERKLLEAKIQFTAIGENCLAFANGTKLENVIDINSEAVVQDLNSQRVGEMLNLVGWPEGAEVWDCCAASGGKSIMAFDLLSNINLSVSDVRQSIIQNLYARFKAAGIKGYQSFVADLTTYKRLQAALATSTFDLIICDAPCSGSGTWSRTPEQLRFFKQEEIKRYSQLQKSIAINTLPFLNKGGCFLYITCSVFKRENEEVVDFIQKESNLTLINMGLFKGYDLKADTMFAALFRL